jgi:hypothetical protein
LGRFGYLHAGRTIKQNIQTYLGVWVPLLKAVAAVAVAVGLVRVVALGIRVVVVTRRTLTAGAAVAVDEVTELRDLCREFGSGVANRLVVENILDRLVVHDGEMDILTIRSELVVAAHEAEEVQDHARVTHVEAKSQV